jgi:predicted ATPase
MSVREVYEEELQKRGYQSDPAQLRAIEALERVPRNGPPTNRSAPDCWVSYSVALKSPRGSTCLAE